MSATTYAVIRNGEGWTVFQDGEAVEDRASKAVAVELAHVLAMRSESFGQCAELLVQDEGGELQSWDPGLGQKLLARLYAGRRGSRAEA